MIIADILGFWYLRGYRGFVLFLVEKMRAALSFFSISALIRTLFAPFRQISVDATGPGAFFDHLVSRVVGATVRIFLMIAGILVFMVELVLSVVLMVAYPLVPLLPVAFVVLFMKGVAV